MVEVAVPFVHALLKKDPSKKVLCPFDTEYSEFVLRFQETYQVSYSHINAGNFQRDFFDYSVPELQTYDIIISNPPFSRKVEVFQRLLVAGKPFAMVMNMMALSYHSVSELFVGQPIQFLIPDKKISYDGNYSMFASWYVCSKLLPKDIIFSHVSSCKRRQKRNFGQRPDQA